MSERKEHWENVYLHKSPTLVSWYQEEPTLSLLLIAGAALQLDAPIIDVGGGASTLVDKLCDEGYTNVSVLDVSANALANARNRLADRACTVQWFEEDVTCFKPPQRFALWHDRAVFHFLTNKADRQKYIDVLGQSLEPGGCVIIMTFAVDGPSKCSGLDVVQYDEEKMTAELGPGFEPAETGHQIHITPAGHQQEFAYFCFRAVGETV